jgi:hypothetical protein
MKIIKKGKKKTQSKHKKNFRQIGPGLLGDGWGLRFVFGRLHRTIVGIMYTRTVLFGPNKRS